jgi:hypothetical protein
MIQERDIVLNGWYNHIAEWCNKNQIGKEFDFICI